MSRDPEIEDLGFNVLFCSMNSEPSVTPNTSGKGKRVDASAVTAIW